MSRFCVVEGTKITLNNKETIPIEEIKVGQEILSFNLNTLQKSQKYDILVKLKTNEFDGIFNNDLVKNVWKNTAEEYYLINDKLKITGDHIVLAKRDQTYYWTKVEKLLINDYLFTELNIFERINSIAIVKEPVKVFNLEVNRVFNYFANSYLIHNGAPCSACLACGNTLLDFIFTPYDYASYGGTNSYNFNGNNNWLSRFGNPSTAASINGDTTGNSWSDGTWSLSPISDVIAKINTDTGESDTTHFSRRVYLNKDDTSPAYSARGLLPFFNTTDQIEVWFDIKAIGTLSSSNINNPSTANNYDLWGIGIMHKFLHDSSPGSAGAPTWDPGPLVTDYPITSDYRSGYLRAAASGDEDRIFGDSKIMLRMTHPKATSTVYNSGARDMFIFGTVNTITSNKGGNTIINLTGVIGTIPAGTVYLFGGGITTSVTLITVTGNDTITVSNTGTTNILVGDILGFSTNNYFSGGVNGNRFPAGMGFKNDQAYTIGANEIENFDTSTELPSLLANDKVGFTITIPGDIDSSDGTGGQKITFQHYSGSTKTTIFEKFLPTHYFDAANKLQLLSGLDSGTNKSHEGAWSVFVFDSTGASGYLYNRHITLEVVEPP